MRQETQNTFTEGFATDYNPLATSNNIMTDCLNGTIITYNGNEYTLQNDMGNYGLQYCKLPKHYIPMGIKEYANILYIVSYNPIDQTTQIGSYPSPQTMFESEVDSNSGTLTNIIPTSTINNGNMNYAVELNYLNSLSQIQMLVTDNMSDSLLNPGDKYIIKEDDDGNIDNTDYGFQVLSFYILTEDKKMYSLSNYEINHGKTVSGGENYVAWEMPGYMCYKIGIPSIYKFNLTLSELGLKFDNTTGDPNGLYGTISSSIHISDKELHEYLTEENGNVLSDKIGKYRLAINYSFYKDKINKDGNVYNNKYFDVGQEDLQDLQYDTDSENGLAEIHVSSNNNLIITGDNVYYDLDNTSSQNGILKICKIDTYLKEDDTIYYTIDNIQESSPNYPTNLIIGSSEKLWTFYPYNSFVQIIDINNNNNYQISDNENNTYIYTKELEITDWIPTRSDSESETLDWNNLYVSAVPMLIYAHMNDDQVQMNTSIYLEDYRQTYVIPFYNILTNDANTIATTIFKWKTNYTYFDENNWQGEGEFLLQYDIRISTEAQQLGNKWYYAIYHLYYENNKWNSQLVSDSAFHDEVPNQYEALIIEQTFPFTHRKNLSSLCKNNEFDVEGIYAALFYYSSNKLTDIDTIEQFKAISSNVNTYKILPFFTTATTNQYYEDDSKQNYLNDLYLSTIQNEFENQFTDDLTSIISTVNASNPTLYETDITGPNGSGFIDDFSAVSTKNSIHDFLIPNSNYRCDFWGKHKGFMQTKKKAGNYFNYKILSTQLDKDCAWYNQYDGTKWGPFHWDSNGKEIPLERGNRQALGKKTKNVKIGVEVDNIKSDINISLKDLRYHGYLFGLNNITITANNLNYADGDSIDFLNKTGNFNDAIFSTSYSYLNPILGYSNTITYNEVYTRSNTNYGNLIKTKQYSINTNISDHKFIPCMYVGPLVREAENMERNLCVVTGLPYKESANSYKLYLPGYWGTDNNWKIDRCLCSSITEFYDNTDSGGSSYNYKIPFKSSYSSLTDYDVKNYTERFYVSLGDDTSESDIKQTLLTTINNVTDTMWTIRYQDDNNEFLDDAFFYYELSGLNILFLTGTSHENLSTCNNISYTALSNTVLSYYTENTKQSYIQPPLFPVHLAGGYTNKSTDLSFPIQLKCYRNQGPKIPILKVEDMQFAEGYPSKDIKNNFTINPEDFGAWFPSDLDSIDMYELCIFTNNTHTFDSFGNMWKSDWISTDYPRNHKYMIYNNSDIINDKVSKNTVIHDEYITLYGMGVISADENNSERVIPKLQFVHLDDNNHFFMCDTTKCNVNPENNNKFNSTNVINSSTYYNDDSGQLINWYNNFYDQMICHSRDEDASDDYITFSDNVNYSNYHFLVGRQVMIETDFRDSSINTLEKNNQSIDIKYNYLSFDTNSDLNDTKLLLKQLSNTYLDGISYNIFYTQSTSSPDPLKIIKSKTIPYDVSVLNNYKKQISDSYKSLLTTLEQWWGKSTGFSYNNALNKITNFDELYYSKQAQLDTLNDNEIENLIWPFFNKYFRVQKFNYDGDNSFLVNALYDGNQSIKYWQTDSLFATLSIIKGNETFPTGDEVDIGSNKYYINIDDIGRKNLNGIEQTIGALNNHVDMNFNIFNIIDNNT